MPFFYLNNQALALGNILLAQDILAENIAVHHFYDADEIFIFIDDFLQFQF